MQTVGAESVARVHTVGVLAKALDVLEELVWGEPRTIRELADETGIEKAAVYRILNTLMERGFAAKDEARKTYGPGPRLLAAASALRIGSDLAALATPQMAALRDELGETVNLGALVGPEVQYLNIVESPHSLRMSASIGSKDPVHSTALGKAILAQMDERAVTLRLTGAGLPPATARTLADLEALKEDLEQVRRRGFAIDNEENEVGAVCVAAPILQPNGTVRHALSVSGPATRMTPEVVERAAPRLIEACAVIADLAYGEQG